MPARHLVSCIPTLVTHRPFSIFFKHTHTPFTILSPLINKLYHFLTCASAPSLPVQLRFHPLSLQSGPRRDPHPKCLASLAVFLLQNPVHWHPCSWASLRTRYPNRMTGFILFLPIVYLSQPTRHLSITNLFLALD